MYRIFDSEDRINLLKILSSLEYPSFKELPSELSKMGSQNYTLYASLLASIVRNRGDLFNVEEIETIGILAERIHGLQIISDTAWLKGYYIIENRADFEVVNKNYALKVISFVNKGGRALIPAGPADHNVILEIIKQENPDMPYLFKFYNAGYGVNMAEEHESIYTHEATPKTQRKVWGLEVYQCKSEVNAYMTVFLTVAGIHFDEVCSISNFLNDGLLLGPIERKPTHIQSVPNCSTRTTREFLRFNLPEETYRKVYKIISGQDYRVNMDEIRIKAPELGIEISLRQNGIMFESLGLHDGKYIFKLPQNMSVQVEKNCPHRIVSGRENVFSFEPLELRNFYELTLGGMNASEALVSVLAGRCSDFYQTRALFNSLYEYNCYSDLPQPIR